MTRSMKTLSLVVALGALLAACGGSAGAGSSATTTITSRPSSPAKLAIASPRNGQVIKGSTVKVRLRLSGARIVRPTSQHITPTTGHVHVFLDNRIISMNYGLTDSIGKVSAGPHVLRVEFVASDHLPFDPRVVASAVFRVTR